MISSCTVHSYGYLIVKILKHSPVALLQLNIIERILASEISQSKSISLVMSLNIPIKNNVMYTAVDIKCLTITD